jgi:hypothetical protein
MAFIDVFTFCSLYLLQESAILPVLGQNSTGQSTSTTLRNPSLAHKHDSAGSLLFKATQLNRVYTSM